MPGRAWLGRASLSCLWLAGAFPSVPFRNLRPSPVSLQYGWRDKPRSSFLSSFPRAGPARPWPAWASGHRGSPTMAAPSRVLAASCRALPGPVASRVPSQGGSRQSALLLLLRRLSLASGACCQARPVLGVWTCFPAFHSRSGLSREKEPWAGQGQCLTRPLDPTP